MSSQGSRPETIPKKRHRVPGDTNIKGKGFDLHPQVAISSAALIVLFVALTLIFREQADQIFQAIQNTVSNIFGWFFILVANIYLGVVVILSFSKYGKIRLGGPDAKPEFSTFGWFAMLLSAGMGIGLMFWSVAEPVYHLGDPAPFFGNVADGSTAAAQAAMGITFYHWGLHAWGIYALVGLSLGFFAFNRGLPLTIRSVFYPILGERIYGWPGNAIDILAVLATLFGLATSLGFGAEQVSAGLNFLFDSPDTVWVQVILIAIITSFATASVVAGLDSGVRFLSEINIYIAAAFLVFLLLAGPTLFLLSSLVQNFGYYASIFPGLSFWTETFDGGRWQQSWTIFYWGWWISWSPFVGMFIARVSKGRTVREFIWSVLFIPSLLSFMWMSVFGGSALKLILDGVGDLGAAVQENVATALFVMLQNFPFTGLSSFLGVVLVVTFFVTSSDSGSLVVDHLTSGGKLDSPVPQRIFWAVTEGVVAAVLLLGGGLKALQTAAIATGLPFAIVLLVMCFSLYRGLAEDAAELEARKLQATENPPAAGGNGGKLIEN
ncbi:BCCT family transporter [Lyngbya sp. CCY1209]|uniref:BCCT family transporter n=1 Tax=Lyngbya sp. CCY1209 TaxID=2886103 RepID=UPI002D201B84|nr:BCCT family transporter [Lyngbya sp. CCY1209]MEB3885062.1 BCCT family transporter [Lyngbya sp. CCY1209]